MLFCIVGKSKQSYEILYTKQINNSDNIHLIDTNGKTKQITNNPRKDSSPMLSPDGNFIVFTSERVGWWKIWLLDIKKKEYLQLTNSGSAEYGPSWSLDGSKIVFVSSRTGNSEIFLMNRDGSGFINLTNDGRSDTMPFWGKDNRIYYSSEVNGTYQIMRMKPDGSNKEVLTKGSGDKLMPQLSNDGKRILYYGNENGNMELYIINLDNQEQVRLTNHPLIDMRGRWSPDDKKIVFERGNKGNNHHIYIMDSNGNNVTKLTSSGYNYAASFVSKNVSLF